MALREKDISFHKEINSTKSCLAPTLKSYFGTMINMNKNNFNFKIKIILKSRADRKTANRYVQLRTVKFK